MAHLTLYRKFRPTCWNDVIGQEHIVTTLINQINNDAVGHAYIFTGTRGTGKTSSAKIFARAVNCQKPQNGSPCGKCQVCLALQRETNIDIVEMDAASNNGVDEIRELRENIQYPPTIGKYRVYIIDEAHMLTGAAFNALLKTLEEPPAHAIFILATTEVHKLPQTILSRCMRFDFRLVGINNLQSLLVRVFNEINYKYDIRALEQLAIHGEGSVRDTLSLAEMCASFAPEYLSYESVLEVLGASDFSTISQLCNAIFSGDLQTLLSTTNKIYQKGKGLSTVNKELSSFVTDLIAIKNIDGYKASFTAEEYSAAKQIADSYDNYRIGRTMDILASVENLIKYSTQPKIVFEASLIKAAELQTEPNIEALTSRVRMLENKMKDFQAHGITLQPAAISPNKDTQTSTIDAVLSAQATPLDCAPVFESAPVTTVASEETEKIWGRLLTQLREENNAFIYFALRGVPSACLNFSDSENSLVLTSSDSAVSTLLNNAANADIVNAAIKTVCGDDYSFHFSTTASDTVASSKDRATLADLFGAKLIDKTIK